jgi:hypothetical protein
MLSLLVVRFAAVRPFSNLWGIAAVGVCSWSACVSGVPPLSPVEVEAHAYDGEMRFLCRLAAIDSGAGRA